MPPLPPSISPEVLLDRYDLFFLDAYGVLVDARGPLRGAAQFIENLKARGKEMQLLSNDASRLPASIAKRLQGFGLPVEEQEISSSGMLLAPYFAEAGLRGRSTVVLGPEESMAMVEAAGGVLVALGDDDAEVVVVADEAGFDLLPGIEAVLTTILRRLDRGQSVALVLPNPDLIYPKEDDGYGLGVGAIALWLEKAIQIRHPGLGIRFVHLGKPDGRAFCMAAARASSFDPARTVMLGDQLPTDVAGAAAFGIDSVLLGSGLTRLDERIAEVTPRPTWICEGL